MALRQLATMRGHMSAPIRSVFAITLAVSLVSAIGGVPFNTMPLLLSSFDPALGLTGDELGTLSSLAFFGYLVGTLSGPVWVDRVNWRNTSLTVSILAAVMFALSANAGGMMLKISWVGFGFFCSLMHALCMRILAEMPDEERAYGTRLSVELITISALLYVLPIFFISKYHYVGAAWALAGFVLILGLGAFLMPERQTDGAAAQTAAFPGWHQAKTSWIALGVFLLYCLANVGLWIFLAKIGEKFNPEPAQFSTMFAMLKIIGGAAGIIGALIGSRAGNRLPNMICFLIIGLGCYGIYRATDFNSFMIACWVWEFGFTMGCIYQTAGVARFDPTNRLVVLVPTAFAISSVVGAKLAGMLSAGGDYTALYIFVAICSLIPGLYYASLKKGAIAVTAAQ